MARKPIRFAPNQRVCVQFDGGSMVFKGTIIREAGFIRRNGDNEWVIRLDGGKSDDAVLVADSEMLLLVNPFNDGP